MYLLLENDLDPNSRIDQYYGLWNRFWQEKYFDNLSVGKYLAFNNGKTNVFAGIAEIPITQMQLAIHLIRTFKDSALLFWSTPIDIYSDKIITDLFYAATIKQNFNSYFFQKYVSVKYACFTNR